MHRDPLVTLREQVLEWARAKHCQAIEQGEASTGGYGWVWRVKGGRLALAANVSRDADPINRSRAAPRRGTVDIRVQLAGGERLERAARITELGLVMEPDSLILEADLHALLERVGLLSGAEFPPPQIED